MTTSPKSRLSRRMFHVEHSRLFCEWFPTSDGPYLWLDEEGEVFDGADVDLGAECGCGEGGVGEAGAPDLASHLDLAEGCELRAYEGDGADHGLWSGEDLVAAGP